MRSLMTTLFALGLAHAATAEGAGPNGPVAEIVTFRLIDGARPNDFRDAADRMGPFLRSTGAITARTLSVDETGLWTDHIIWTSRDAALAAAAQMFDRPEAQPFMAMIDPEGMVMRHAAIVLQQE